MSMTPEAKKLLATTIRALRARLLAELAARTESAYQLGLKAKDATLDEENACKRRRLEEYLDEQVRAQPGRDKSRDTADFRREVEQTAAYTLLNRLVVLRLMEATGLRRQALVTEGWESPAYKIFRDLAPTLRDDKSEGYELLLRLVFEELAGELPGLYGPAGPGGVAELIQVPPSTLRHVIEALDQPGLASCWTDDMTLGWIYQYWNDPEREALDDKILGGGKIAPHEIASKTQMFTERYMVDWLLQNSLGPMWLAMCQRHGWTAEAKAHGTLDELEARRIEWRAKRERGEVSSTELMPLHSDSERRWAYYVPQPIPESAVQQAPASVRELKILDPAVGSGHFLVAAFELLVALYREEARHRDEEGQERWTDRAIVEHILSDNLHGIDLDPRAVQIAAATLWLKAQQTCPGAHPRELHLVASNLRLASLPKDDPALVELRREVERETGIPAALTDRVVAAVAGADHLGSLLQIDSAVERALDEHEHQLTKATDKAVQGEFTLESNGGPFTHFPQQQRALIGREEAKLSILGGLEGFLRRHTRGDDLGLRLRGEQLAAGVRFVRMVREGTYDLVVGNPPYQGIKKLASSALLKKSYPLGRANLFACFIVRGMSLTRRAGISAMTVPTAWMYSEQYASLRKSLISSHRTAVCADLGAHAFQQIGGEVVTTSLACWVHMEQDGQAIRILSATEGGISQKIATCLTAASELHYLDPASLDVVPGNPLLYRWTKDKFEWYAASEKFSDVCSVRYGSITGDDVRFLRNFWEVPASSSDIQLFSTEEGGKERLYEKTWFPYIKGAAGQRWYEPVEYVCKWGSFGLECKVRNDHRFGSFSRLIQNEAWNFVRGIAFTSTGSEFGARLHRAASVIGAKGRSIFTPSPERILCLLNSRTIGSMMAAFNPSLDFNIGDVNRLPVFAIPNTEQITSIVNTAFTGHESHREPSIEFRHPGPSPWRQAQDWAQKAVDRPDGAPLPAYLEELDPEPAVDHLSFALSVALGRFGADGTGILDPRKDDLKRALPAGILFINTTLDSNDLRDSLREPAAKLLLDTWRVYGPAIAPKAELREYLANEFFEHHRKQYEGRPIHWPLSSEKRSFVAWTTIHRWESSTLRLLLADHLRPALTDIDGELRDIRAAQVSANKAEAQAAEKQLAKIKNARAELEAFIASVEQCAEKGPPPVDAKCPARAVDARYDPDLDDGVMINAAALWPLFPVKQWKEPRKWWKELASADGKKDYDWSHLAMRYWPKRVDDKCVKDPSLAVAHGCFWKYHPTRAWTWELRLQDEIGPEFRIEEAPYRGDGGHEAHRAIFLADHAIDALAIVEKEVLRRTRKQVCFQDELRLLETGLWSEVPDQCWDLELRIIRRYRAILKKQLVGSVWGELKEFRLRAPDEAAARAAFMAGNPSAVRKRQQLLEAALDFVFSDEDEDDDVDDEAEAVADEADEGDDE